MFQSRTKLSVRNLHITEEMVKIKIKALNTNKSCGPDDIHPKLISELADHISTPLKTRLNLSISSGIIPNEWKLANVTPVFKKGSKHIPGNYRPISLTCIICRIMESFLKNAIMAHLVENNLLSPRQHGFI